MSRTRGHGRKGSRGYPVCRGCTACSWYPKRFQREGRRDLHKLKREIAAEDGVPLLQYRMHAAGKDES